MYVTPLKAQKMKSNNLYLLTDTVYKTDTNVNSIGYGKDKVTQPYNYLFSKNNLTSHILQTISRHNSQNQMDTSDDIFENRLGLIRSKLELILLQLKKRKEINTDILYQIEIDSCRVQSLQFELCPLPYEMGPDKITLEKMKLDLQRQKRMEQVSYFKDTGFLNRDLKETLIQYLEEVQKSDLINGEDEL